MKLIWLWGLSRTQIETKQRLVMSSGQLVGILDTLTSFGACTPKTLLAWLHDVRVGGALVKLYTRPSEAL